MSKWGDINDLPAFFFFEVVFFQYFVSYLHPFLDQIHTLNKYNLSYKNINTFSCFFLNMSKILMFKIYSPYDNYTKSKSIRRREANIEWSQYVIWALKKLLSALKKWKWKVHSVIIFNVTSKLPTYIRWSDAWWNRSQYIFSRAAKCCRIVLIISTCSWNPRNFTEWIFENYL